MLKVAVVPDNVPVPRFVAPSKNVTVPVGVPDAPLIVAVKVTLCAIVDGLTDDVTAVVVVALFTTWIKTEEVLVA